MMLKAEYLLYDRAFVWLRKHNYSTLRPNPKKSKKLKIAKFCLWLQTPAGCLLIYDTNLLCNQPQPVLLS